jgi:hypothetical protein
VVQGHAEVVQLELSDDSSSEFAAFADKYFNQFVKTPFGMMRQVTLHHLPHAVRHCQRQP